MELRLDQDRFVIEEYPGAKAFLQPLGFQYDKLTKVFFTVDTQIARQFQHYATTDAQIEMFRREAEMKQARELSRVEDSNLYVPSNRGLKYDPFQLGAVVYSKTRKKVLLADEQGLGKTIEAIGIINYLIWSGEYVAPRVLVISEKHLMNNWEYELGKWLIEEHGIQQATANYFPVYSQIAIINYDIVDRHHDALRMCAWDILICDEVQKISNSNANRTRYILGDTAVGIEPIPSDRAIFLSGTPFNNRPWEFFPVLHYLAPDLFNDRLQYGIRYCAGYKTKKGKWNFKGASNGEELQAKARAHIMCRRLKKDVMKDLPPKRRQVIEIPPPDENVMEIKELEAAITAYNNGQMEEASKRIENSEDLTEEEYRELMAALPYQNKVPFTKISEYRFKTAVAKVPFVLQHLKDVLSDGRKVVVFAYHHFLMEAIKKEFPDACMVSGISTEDPSEEVRKFQDPDGPKLFICSLKKATGITLTAASHEVFAELSWTSTDILQAEDRCHRRGQLESLFIQFIVLEHSLDANLCHKIVSKLEMLDKTLNNRDEKIQELPEQVLP